MAVDGSDTLDKYVDGTLVERDTVNNKQLFVNVGIGTTAPTEKLDVNSDAIRIRTSQTPASAGASGNVGDICWDGNYVYVCVATNSWKRASLATW